MLSIYVVSVYFSPIKKPFPSSLNSLYTHTVLAIIIALMPNPTHCSSFLSRYVFFALSCPFVCPAASFSWDEKWKEQ